jgi:hypothetical protein
MAKGMTLRQEIALKLNSKWAKHAAKVGRTALEVFVAIKKRDPFYGAVAIFSGVEAITSLAEEAISVSAILEKNGYLRAFSSLEQFVWTTLSKMGYESTLLCEVKKSGDSKSGSALMEMKVKDAELCFEFYNGALRGAYAKDPARAATVFIEVVRDYYSDSILLTTETTGWTTYLVLDDLVVDMGCFVTSLEEKELTEVLIKFRREGHASSALLSGRPGCGKTTLAHRVAKEMKGALIVVDAAALNHICDENLRIEPLIQSLAPAVLLFDDLDRVREFNLNTMLGLVERIYHKCSETVFFGTVNDLSKLPEALTRPERFDDIVQIDPPDVEDRFKIIKGYCEEFGTRLADDLVRTLAEKSEGLTPAYLKEIGRRATILSFDRLEKHVDSMIAMSSVGKKDKEGEPKAEGHGVQYVTRS